MYNSPPLAQGGSLLSLQLLTSVPHWLWAPRHHWCRAACSILTHHSRRTTLHLRRRTTPSLDAVAIIEGCSHRLCIQAKDGRTKLARPHARCPECFPLFPLMRQVKGGALTAAKAPPSASAFSGTILTGRALAGAHQS